MPRPTSGAAAAVACLSASLLAQAGNEIVFVATSTSGSTDSHFFVASGTGAVPSSGGNNFTDNVSDAVWADTGRNLYVSQASPVQAYNRVSLAQWDGANPTWSTFYQAPGACYELGLDRWRNRLYVLTGATGSTRELHCLDADPNSPSYGQLIVQSTTLSGVSRERWDLSPSGNLAVVPHAFINSGLLQIVDTDPASASYLQIVVSVSVPGAAASGFAFTSDCKVSIDDEYAYLLYSGIGASALAVLHIPTQTWLDFGAGAGQQDLVLSLPVANRMALSLDRSFAILSGQGGTGWAMRVDFDYVTAANTVTTQYTGLTVPNCDGVSLSPDQTRAAVTSTAVFLSAPSNLVIFDVQSGAVLQSVVLNGAWNVYTTAWQDASPTATFTPYGSGCAGTLGTPTLAAQAGSRPALGTTFTAVAGNLPFGVGALGLGLSQAFTTGGLPLSFDLGVVGMTGCNLLADPLVLAVLVGAGNSADWSWSLPSTRSLFGQSFFAQAFSLDPGANAFGFTASNGGAGWIGF
ncbi:MAG TPA: hypothetical protein VFZ65_09445 [Planctomycetota bacterium]|nr:hypothetical protein [Planctomycetota bacterium]